MSKSVSEIFIQEAIKTESKDFSEIQKRLGIYNNQSYINLRLIHTAFGMQTETAEFTDMLKKYFFYGKDVDKINLVEELGDLLWYIAIACDTLSISLDEVMQINMKKLARRYHQENKEKQFSEEKAITRDLASERNILESNYDGIDPEPQSTIYFDKTDFDPKR